MSSFLFSEELIIDKENNIILEAKAKIGNLKLWCDKSELDNKSTKAVII